MDRVVPGPKSCPLTRRLIRFLTEEGGGEEAGWIDGHLESCEACASAVAGLSSVEPPGLATVELLAMAARVRPTSNQTSSPGSFSFDLSLARSLELPAGPTDPFAPPPTIPGLRNLVEIGRGGMGVVYRAWDEELRRVVAVKVFHARGRHSTVERMLREARAMAPLHHPNVVAIHHCGEADGVLYLVMEWIEGGTLEQKLAAGPLPFQVAARFVRDLSRALEVAHRLGIIHRDLKPANILLARVAGVEEPTPKLADFGLAQLLDEERLTDSAIIMGTPSYMAPEQTGLAQGPDLERQVTPATDIHAMGAILHASLSGRPPYQGNNAWETLVNVASNRPVSLRSARPGVPRDLETIVAKCLEPIPSRRYASAAALAGDLDRYLTNRPVAARPLDAPRRLVKWARRRPTLAASLALSAVLAVAASLGVLYHARTLGETLEALKLEQARTRIALEKSEVARARAIRAIQSLTDDSISSLLERAPALDLSGRAYLRRVTSLLEEPFSEPESVSDTGHRLQGLERIMKTYGRVGLFDEMVEVGWGLIHASDGLLARDPGLDFARQIRLATLRECRAQMQSASRFVDAKAFGRELVRSLRQSGPDDVRRWTELGIALNDLGQAHYTTNDFRDAEALLRESRDWFEKALRADPGEPRILLELVRASSVHAVQLKLIDRKPEAIAAYDRAAELIRLGRERGVNPKSVDSLELHVLSGRANFLSEEGHAEEAMPLRRRAMALAGEIAAHDRKFHPFQHTWHSTIGSYHAQGAGLGRLETGLAEIGEAVEVAERLRVLEPSSFAHAASSINAHRVRANFLQDMGDPQAALKDAEVGIEVALAWVGRSLESTSVSRTLIDLTRVTANILLSQGRVEEALRRWERAEAACLASDKPACLAAITACREKLRPRDESGP